MDWMKTARANARAMDQTMRQNPYKARLRRAGESARKNGLAPQPVQTANTENKLSGLTDVERLSLVFGNKTTNTPLSDNLKTAGEQMKNTVNAKLANDGAFANTAVKNLRANGQTEAADNLKSQLDALERERHIAELRAKQAEKSAQQISMPKPIFPQSSTSSFASPGVKEIGENLITRYNAQAMQNYLGSREYAHKQETASKRAQATADSIYKEMQEYIANPNVNALDDPKILDYRNRYYAAVAESKPSETQEWETEQYLDILATGGMSLLEEFTEHYFQLRDAVDKASVTNPGVQNNGAWKSARENYDRWYNGMVSRLGKDNVDRWIEYGTRIHDQQVAEEFAGNLRAHAQENSVGDSILSLPLHLASGIGFINAVGQKIENTITGKDYPVNYNTPTQRFSRIASGIRSAVSDEIAQGKGGQVGSFLYNTGMSMLDSATMLATGNVGAAMLGGAAATNAMHEAKQRGASDNQAFAVGLVSAIAEGVMEKNSIDKLFGQQNGKGVRNTIWNMLKQAGAEGTEEGLTNIVNTVANAVIMGDKSQLNATIDDYMADGYSEQEATRMAIGEWAKNFGLDVLGGVISGSVFSIGKTGLDVVRNRGMKAGTLSERLHTKKKEAGLPQGNPNSSSATTSFNTNIADFLNFVNHKPESTLSSNVPVHLDNQTSYDLKGKKWVSEAQIKTALADIMDHGDMGDDNMVRLGEMPQFIQNISGISGELYLFRNHAYDNMSTKEQAEADGRIARKEKDRRNQHFHGLGEETMTQAILALNEPLITIADKGDKGNPALSMILPVFDKNGDPIHAVVRFYENEPINGAYKKRPHVAVTFYGHPYQFEDGSGRKTIVDVVSKAIEENKVLDYDSKKVRADLPVIAQDSTLRNIAVPTLMKNVAQFQKEVNRFKQNNKIYYNLGGELEQNEIDRLFLEGFEEDANDGMNPILGINKNTAALLKQVAEDLNIKMEFVDSIWTKSGKEANGSLDSNGIMQISRNADRPVHTVAAHETTHRLKQLAPSAYEKFRDLAVQMDPMALDDVVQRYGDDAATLEMAKDEVAAELAEEIFRDENKLKQLIEEANKSQERRNAVQKFFDVLRDVIQKLKQTIQNLYSKGYSDSANRLSENLSEMEFAEQLWKEAYAEAKINISTLENQSDTEYTDSESMFSVKKGRRAQRGRSIEMETMENNRFDRIRQFHDELPSQWYAYTKDYFYIYSNHSFMDYTPLLKVRITEANKQYIDFFEEELHNGAYGSTEVLDYWLANFRRGKGRYSWNYVGTSKRGTTD